MPESETVVAELTDLTALCARFGIKVIRCEGIDIPDRYEGPMGQGCNPKKRLVYFENNSAWAEIEHYFHELVHCIVDVPWWPIAEAPEEFILFQYERALARATLEDWAVERVVDWQHETGVVISGKYPGDLCLGDLAPYENKTFWRFGFQACRVLGLLDARNRPTFKSPRWERLAPYAHDIRRYFETKAETPLPRLP